MSDVVGLHTLAYAAVAASITPTVSLSQRNRANVQRIHSALI